MEMTRGSGPSRISLPPRQGLGPVVKTGSCLPYSAGYWEIGNGRIPNYENKALTEDVDAGEVASVCLGRWGHPLR